ncbi:cyclopropane-fatty-acyl-phospholipid synthase family protein [Alphaproteobacteria bacterium]|nr:cyclopropane-fatty-acyl-phospholipid synthase family protein [Alphaproteobacteria bacterium]
MLFNTQGKLDLFLDVLAQSKYGSICVYKDNKSIFSFKGKFPGPDTNIKILKDKCISDFFLRGDLGWAESYIDGNWETSNLTDFLEWGARNFHEFSKYVRGKWFTILYLRLKHHLKKNSRTGSKKNISFHYDLGNSFYEKWLDESMTYSSAMFKDPGDNLHKGQINKYENLANITGVKECDKILEVGCGWGGFSSFLAKRYSANVTAITISKKQYEKAKQKIYEDKLTEKVDIKLLDYRNINGKYDKIVSIEMFEAVGEKYWSKYFDVLKKNLKSDGSIGLQTITIEDKFFQKYKKFPDFIQTYIFPGGMLPSVEEMNKVIISRGLHIKNKKMFGNDYAKTIRIWSESFENSWGCIKSLGFSESFKRLWNYYLGYCEGGFKSGNINVGQFLIKKA